MTVSASYLLADDPAASSFTTASPTAAASPADAAGQSVKRGLLLPFRRDGKSDFANASGSAVWVARVELLLSIQGPTPTASGELVFRPLEGASLQLLRHKNNTSIVRAMAQQYLLDAFRRSLPEVVLTEVLPLVPEPNRLVIPFTFDVRSGSSLVHSGLKAQATVRS